MGETIKKRLVEYSREEFGANHRGWVIMNCDPEKDSDSREVAVFNWNNKTGYPVCNRDMRWGRRTFKDICNPSRYDVKLFSQAVSMSYSVENLWKLPHTKCVLPLDFLL